MARVELNANGARFFDLRPGVVSIDVLQARINWLHTVYREPVNGQPPRYAPENREEGLQELEEWMGVLDLEPQEFVPRVTSYCGSSYILPNDVLGTQEECHKRGIRLGDHHGTLQVKSRQP